MTQDKGFQVSGYILNDMEYNLIRMFHRTIQLAFNRHPAEPMEWVAQVLGISERTLHKVVRDWKIQRPKGIVMRRRADMENRGVLKEG